MVDESGVMWGPGFAKQAVWTSARGRLARCSGDGSGPFSTMESAPLFCLSCWETALLRFLPGTSFTKTLSTGQLNAFSVSPCEPRGHFPARVGRVGMGFFSRTQTRLSDFTFTFRFHALEKEMATHSSVLAWGISRMGEPGGLLSMGSHRVGHD